MTMEYGVGHHYDPVLGAVVIFVCSTWTALAVLRYCGLSGAGVRSTSASW